MKNVWCIFEETKLVAIASSKKKGLRILEEKVRRVNESLTKKGYGKLIYEKVDCMAYENSQGLEIYATKREVY